MNRVRIASKEMDAAEILKAVEVLEKVVQAADDKSLVSEADGEAKEEKKVVNESVPAGKADLKDNGDQDAKANKNWPTSEAEKTKVAKKLVTLARQLMGE